MSAERPATPPQEKKKPYDPVHAAPSLPNSPAPLAKRAKIDSMTSQPTGTTPIPSQPAAPMPPHAEPHGANNGELSLPSVSSLVEPRNSPATAQLIRQEDMLIATSPLQVARLSDKAKLPTRGSVLAAGYDLYSAKATTIKAGGRALVPTDLAIATPPGTYGRVAPRSGLSVKKGLHTGAGVIDGDYRGHVMVLLFNQGDEAVEVDEGERCAQLILERYVGADVVDVTAPATNEGQSGAEELDMRRAKGLAPTDRGVGGFGSTGAN